MGAISGDSADVLSAEWQQSLGQAWKGQWQAVAFVDTARITINPVGTAGPNTVSLSGAGIGLNWTGPAQLTARSAIAIPLGAGSELVNANKSVRAWLEVQKVF
jgi:hemolysin activation/secretion protein